MKLACGYSAAPGIAAGVAALAGTTVVATAAAFLTSTAAVTAIFGVGGGGLVAYKMQRRTMGLTEFEFLRENVQSRKRPCSSNSREGDEKPCAELFSTICISGWARDDCDFQRPWGITPTRPPITDLLEVLERFYFVHKPENVPRCAKILSRWKGEEKQLIELLRRRYGQDPYSLFPSCDRQSVLGSLTHEQEEIVNQLFLFLGFKIRSEEKHVEPTPLELTLLESKSCAEDYGKFSSSLFDSLHGPNDDDVVTTSNNEIDQPSDPDFTWPKHLATVWDYHSKYGGELYTVRWESALLEELCDSVIDLAADVVTGATAHILKMTALSTLVTAMAWPVALKSAANMIDGTWTLVVERADEAGQELAKSLLFSTAGNRPVNLVGFSFGARVIYSCLKELARYQVKWEEFHEGKNNRKGHRSKKDIRESFESMREPASIVDSVVLMGLPNHLSLSSWEACRRIVAGRLIHCFSQKDLILSLMFQYKKFGLKPGEYEYRPCVALI